MLAQHLLQDLWGRRGQSLRAEGLDGLAVLAILNSLFRPPDVVGMQGGGGC